MSAHNAEIPGLWYWQGCRTRGFQGGYWPLKFTTTINAKSSFSNDFRLLSAPSNFLDPPLVLLIGFICLGLTKRWQKNVKFFKPTRSFAVHTEVLYPLCYSERFSSSVEYKDDGEKWICCPEEQPFDEIRWHDIVQGHWWFDVGLGFIRNIMMTSSCSSLS